MIINAITSLTALVLTAIYTQTGYTKVIIFALPYISSNLPFYIKYFTTGLGPTLVYHLLEILLMAKNGLAYAAKISSQRNLVQYIS